MRTWAEMLARGRQLWGLALLPLAAGPAFGNFTVEPNRGQTAPEVRYVGYSGAAAVFFTGRETVLKRGGAVFRWTHPGSRAEARFEPRDLTAERKSYLRGRDRSQWVEDLPVYSRLVRLGIYPGIDLHYRAAETAAGRPTAPLEYDYVVQPGADPGVIRLRFAPGSRARVERDGSLTVEAGGSRLRQRAPVAFTADGTRVEARFRPRGAREVGFALGRYDARQTLTIDPEVWSVDVLGGVGDDDVQVFGLPTGDVGFVGSTTSPDFPGAAAAARRGRDILVRWTTAAPLTLVIGGSGDERAWAAASFSLGVLIVGETNSRDLPVAGASGRIMQPEYGGGDSDGFLMWIPALTSAQRLTWGLTYFGGSGTDRLKAVRVYGATGYLAGETNSPDLPGLRAAGLGAPRQMDLFVWTSFFGSGDDTAVFDPRSVVLIGGSGNEFLGGLSLTGTASSRGTLHVLGETESGDFPRSEPGAPGLRGPSDALWVGWETSFGEMQPRFSRLFGGEGRDRFVALLEPPTDAAVRNWVLAGETTSPTLPQGAAAVRPYAGGTDWFAAWFDPVSAAWQRHTFYGGAGDERLLFVGWLEELLTLAGSTNSATLPLQDPFQERYGGGATDGLFVQMRASGEVALASYFGGDGADRIAGSCEQCYPLARPWDSALPRSTCWACRIPPPGRRPPWPSPPRRPGAVAARMFFKRTSWRPAIRRPTRCAWRAASSAASM